MILINNYSEVSPLVRKYFKAGMVTNNFLKEEDYRFLIDKRLLYYYSWNGGIFFFKKREFDFLCYYQIIDLNFMPNFEELSQLGVPIVVEMVSKTNDRNIQLLKDFFLNLGFIAYLDRVKMKLVNKDNTISGACKYPIECADFSKVDEIKELLIQSFNVHTGCIPSNDELAMDIERNSILIALNEQRKIIGLLHFTNNTNKSEIRHLVVKKEFQNNGIAVNLINIYHQKIGNSRATLWVSKNNDIAIKVYKKNGYSVDDYISTVMIKK